MTRKPALSTIAVHGAEIAFWNWPGDGPPVLFCHAAGFHARIWDQVIAHLPKRRCLAFDARGHGGSSKPAPPYPWRTFGAEAAALAESLELDGAIGVGHSMGGHSVTLAAALHPDAFSALVLLDPVIRAPDRYTGLWTETDFVAKRRNEWTSAQEMFERFASRWPFDAWDRQVLRDYCEHALAPASDGFVLACPPAVEFSIYQHSTAVESNIYADIATIRIPVHVVRSGRYRDPANVMGGSPTMPNLAAHFARGRDTCLPDYSHFIPMEAPELTAKFVQEALALL